MECEKIHSQCSTVSAPGYATVVVTAIAFVVLIAGVRAIMVVDGDIATIGDILNDLG